MGIERLWPVGLAIFIPGIIILYLLKQKVPYQKVPALNLWKEAYENMQAVTPWEKFRHRLLMYLQIFALLLLILALLMPYLRMQGGDTGHVVLCLDRSGSMNGIYQEERTRLEEAKQQALRYISRLKQGTGISVVASGKSAEILVVDSTDRQRVESLIEGIEPTDEEGNLQEGVRLAESVVRQWKDYQMIGFTDSDVDLKELNGEIVDLGSAGENAALSWLNHTGQEDGTVQIMAKVVNYGTKSIREDVNLYLGEKLYDIRTAEVAPGQSQIITFKELSAGRYQGILEGTQYLKAELNEPDSLERDNTVYDLLETDEKKKVLLVSEQNAFLEKVLSVEGNVELEKTTSVRNIDQKKKYDLIIYDGMMPERWIAEEDVVLFRPKSHLKMDGEQIVTREKTIKNCRVRIKNTEVTEDLEDASFSVRETGIFQVPEWAYSFLAADQKSAGYFGRRQGRMIAVLGFDLHDSDLPLQIEFPILMHQLLNQSVEAGILMQNSYKPGESVEVICKDGDRVMVQTPEGEEMEPEVGGGRAVVTDTSRSGIYHVTVKGKDREKTLVFQVMFPEEESSLNHSITVQSGEKHLSAKQDAGDLYGTLSLKKPLLIILLIILTIEWIVYRRRL